MLFNVFIKKFFKKIIFETIIISWFLKKVLLVYFNNKKGLKFKKD